MGVGLVRGQEQGLDPSFLTTQTLPRSPTIQAMEEHYVLNRTSFRYTEHTAPSAGNHCGDALATAPPLDLTTQHSVRD